MLVVPSHTTHTGETELRVGYWRALRSPEWHLSANLDLPPLHSDLFESFLEELPSSLPVRVCVASFELVYSNIALDLESAKLPRCRGAMLLPPFWLRQST